MPGLYRGQAVNHGAQRNLTIRSAAGGLMDNDTGDARRLHAVENRAMARRIEAERWKALWDEAHPAATEAPAPDHAAPDKPRRLRSILTLFRRD